MVAGGCVSITRLALVYAVKALTESKIGTVETRLSPVQHGCFWKRPLERIAVMSDKTGIAWTDATWNPITGCSKVSQGCKNCYAEREWGRLSANPKATNYYGRAFTDVACHEDRLNQPLRWKKPRMIFVNSMSDLFHEEVPDAFIDKVFAVMALANRHTFQVLTKRPERMLRWFDLGFDNREHAVGRPCGKLPQHGVAMMRGCRSGPCPMSGWAFRSKIRPPPTSAFRCCYRPPPPCAGSVLSRC